MGPRYQLQNKNGVLSVAFRFCDHNPPINRLLHNEGSEYINALYKTRKHNFNVNFDNNDTVRLGRPEFILIWQIWN